MYTPYMCPRNDPTSPPDPTGSSATKPASRRQTLGSDHDAPPRRASGEEAPGAQSVGAEQLRPAWWDAFKASRTTLIDGEAEKTAGRIIHHVESRWEAIRNLQIACERQREQGAPPGSRLSYYLAFLEDEIALVFVKCADAVTRLEPGAPPGDGVGNDLVCGLAAHFDRGIGVAALAAQANELSPAFRSSMIGITDDLVDWGAEMCTLASALARMVVSEEIPRGERGARP